MVVLIEQHIIVDLLMSEFELEKNEEEVAEPSFKSRPGDLSK